MPFRIFRIRQLAFTSRTCARSYSSAAARAPVRTYYYYIDVHGQLYLHDTRPRNFTTCFKDKKFLDFFFARLQVTPSSTSLLSDAPGNEWFPYVSPCGREMNYVQVEDSPIVFQDLTPDGKNLIYGGNLPHPFDPASLHLSRRTGRLYHALHGPSSVTGKPLPPPLWMLPPKGDCNMDDSTATHSPLGLVRSSLLSSRFAHGVDLENESFEWLGTTHPLTMVP
ncbi:hypothetical protein PhCBS80983_g05661 [Powellomyces hirtus]|uniref:Uncharacterized protein n=1 Tax=Powellomyces hirtus TaxID=109895 RepID=A0A507DVI9_9FUNG|nr:hypothetical protein PhCBS80983_g05661 [Powellomyces hirtus]